MGGHSCHRCVYSVCEADLWLRAMWAGEPIVPRCANHPCWPGQLHDVPGVPCRNYRPKPALPQGDSVRMIPLGDGFYAYIDTADCEELSRHRWHMENGYAARREKGKVVLMHREITQAPDGMVVDHIDANKVNNCRFNLRVCAHAENVQNARKHADARSRFKGISYHKRMRKWRARCTCEGREQVLGFFDNEIDAARAYDRGAVGSFGEHARVNFPKEWPPERRAEVHARWQMAQKLRTEDRRRRTAGGKEGKKKKARRKNSVPRAETPRHGEGKRSTEAGRSEGKKAKAARKSRGGTGKKPKRRTRRKRTGPGRFSD